jgi:hypothetical protein
MGVAAGLSLSLPHPCRMPAAARAAAAVSQPYFRTELLDERMFFSLFVALRLSRVYVGNMTLAVRSSGLSPAKPSCAPRMT